MESVEYIDLTNNSITTIDSGAFASIASEKVLLYLGDNKIDKIDKSAFRNTNFRQISLENNRLKTLEEAVFKPVVALMVKNKSGTINLEGSLIDPVRNYFDYLSRS